jgi:hypothetical protein
MSSNVKSECYIDASAISKGWRETQCQRVMHSDCVCGHETLTGTCFNFETLSSWVSLLGSYIEGGGLRCWDVKMKFCFTVWMLSLCSVCAPWWVFIGRQQNWLWYQRAVLALSYLREILTQSANSDWENTLKLLVLITNLMHSSFIL